MKETLPQPRPGTKTAIVVEQLRMGKSHPQIVKETGLSGSSISYAAYRAYSGGYLDRPSEKERRRMWKESHRGHPHTKEQKQAIARALKGRRRSLEYRREMSKRKGGVGLAVEKYVKLGMSVPEIEVAVLLELGRVLKPEQISNAQKHAKQRGELPRPTPSEKRKILQDRVRSKEEIEFNVRQILDEWDNVQELISKEKLEKVPVGIDDWVLLTRFFHARKEKIRDNEEPLRLFNERLNAVSEETLLRLKPCFEVISSTTSVIKNNGRGPNSEASTQDGQRISNAIVFFRQAGATWPDS